MIFIIFIFELICCFFVSAEIKPPVNEASDDGGEQIEPGNTLIQSSLDINKELTELAMTDYNSPLTLEFFQALQDLATKLRLITQTKINILEASKSNRGYFLKLIKESLQNVEKNTFNNNAISDENRLNNEIEINFSQLKNSNSLII